MLRAIATSVRPAASTRAGSVMPWTSRNAACMASTCSREACSIKVPSMSKSSSTSALIVVDMSNSYDFEDADRLRASVEQALPCMVDLVERAQESGLRIVYVNDNHGAWNQGRSEMIETVLAGEFRELVEPIAPGDDVDFVVKARHSIFYETPLEYLLRQGEIEE